jgi:hypothetical protein
MACLVVACPAIFSLSKEVILVLSRSCRPARAGFGWRFVRALRATSQAGQQFLLDLHDRRAGEIQRRSRRVRRRAVPLNPVPEPAGPCANPAGVLGQP